jgi:hypothetical protein
MFIPIALAALGPQPGQNFYAADTRGLLGALPA